MAAAAAAEKKNTKVTQETLISNPLKRLKIYKPVNKNNWFGVVLQVTSEKMERVQQAMKTKFGSKIKVLYPVVPGTISTKNNKPYEQFHMTVCYGMEEKKLDEAIRVFNEAGMTEEDIQILDTVEIFTKESLHPKTQEKEWIAFGVLKILCSNRFHTLQKSIVDQYAGIVDGQKWQPKTAHVTVCYADLQ